MDPSITDAYRLLGDALAAPDARATQYQKAINLDPGNADALSGLISVIEKRDPQGALKLLESKRRFAGFAPEDYAHRASLQDQTGQHESALRDIATAIEQRPWDFTLYAARRQYETHAKTDPYSVDLHYAQGLREAAAFSARTGSDGAALRDFMEAFRTAAGLPEEGSGTLELASLTRDFSAFLVRRFGRDDAVQWWRSYAANPLASNREQQFSAKEANHLAAEK